MTTMQGSRPMDTCPWRPTARPSCAKSPGACAGITATKGRLALLGAPPPSPATPNASAKASAAGGAAKKESIKQAITEKYQAQFPQYRISFKVFFCKGDDGARFV